MDILLQMVRTPGGKSYPKRRNNGRFFVIIIVLERIRIISANAIDKGAEK